MEYTDLSFSCIAYVTFDGALMTIQFKSGSILTGIAPNDDELQDCINGMRTNLDPERILFREK